MSDTFTLTSTPDGARLEFRDRTSTGTERIGNETYEFASYIATLITNNLSATLRVDDANVAGWSRFFADLAENWRGWKGAKTFGALEGQLGVSCTMDSTGHCELRVRLGGDNGSSNWRAEASVYLEAGQLDSIARAAAEYFG